MKQVSRDEFIKVVSSRKVSRISGPERSVWKDLNTGEVVGYAYPGWLLRNELGPYQGETKFCLEVKEKGERHELAY